MEFFFELHKISIARHSIPRGFLYINKHNQNTFWSQIRWQKQNISLNPFYLDCKKTFESVKLSLHENLYKNPSMNSVSNTFFLSLSVLTLGIFTSRIKNMLFKIKKGLYNIYHPYVIHLLVHFVKTKTLGLVYAALAELINLSPTWAFSTETFLLTKRLRKIIALEERRRNDHIIDFIRWSIFLFLSYWIFGK